MNSTSMFVAPGSSCARHVRHDLSSEIRRRLRRCASKLAANRPARAAAHDKARSSEITTGWARLLLLTAAPSQNASPLTRAPSPSPISPYFIVNDLTHAKMRRDASLPSAALDAATSLVGYSPTLRRCRSEHARGFACACGFGFVGAQREPSKRKGDAHVSRRHTTICIGSAGWQRT